MIYKIFDYNCYETTFSTYNFFILLPVRDRWIGDVTPTLNSAVVCSSRAGSDLGRDTRSKLLGHHGQLAIIIMCNQNAHSSNKRAFQ